VQIFSIKSNTKNTVSSAKVKDQSVAMLFSTSIAAFLASFLSVAASAATLSYVNWTTFNATGVNLGGWLLQEEAIDPVFWAQYGGNTTDEWGLCPRLGSQ
jgi:hypothetical protein